MPLITSILLLAIVTAVTCSVPGIFLVLRHQSMLVDAMSHAVLPGIAIGALLSGSLNSPLLVVITTLMGLVVVIGAECLARTGLVTGDANQGLIFPVLFSIGVILLSTVLTEVHIDESTILAGNINLQALSVNHIVFGTIDIGPITMWKEIVVCAITAIVLFAMRRVLAVATFDPQLARTMGLPVRLTNGILMCLIALTVVVCFDAVGSILVVALMIAPPATALLMAKTLRRMVGWTIVVAVVSAIVGFELAKIWDLATSSMMSAVSGVVFLVVLAGTNIATRIRQRSLAKKPAPTEVHPRDSRAVSTKAVPDAVLS